MMHIGNISAISTKNKLNKNVYRILENEQDKMHRKNLKRVNNSGMKDTECKNY